MPPSRRSSSSRSSSSRSRSSSSRSRSSSSSRSRSSSSRSSSSRSSSSSRPSSRSNSSYTSNYKSSTTSPNNRSSSSHSSLTPKQKTAITFANNYKRPRRTTPIFVHKNSHLSPKYHHCYKHDYYYFDKDFYDGETNTHYKKGYYDENGTFYEELNLQYSENEIIEMLKCEYCGSVEKIDLKNMPTNETLKCSNCCAILDFDNISELNTDYYVCDDLGNFPNSPIIENPQNTTNNYMNQTTNTKPTSRLLIVLVVIVSMCVGCIPICCITNIINSSEYESSYDYDYNYNNNNSDVIINNDYKHFGDSVYIPEIDRTCYFDGEYYYDNETQCYFWYNQELTPAIFQYWYEDFSSQYGDYGWLEYDEIENAWYVETSYDNWEKVENPPSYFWYTNYKELITHSNNSTINNDNSNSNSNSNTISYSELGNNIYVSAIDRNCSFDGEFYYDSITDCYFLYNEDYTPGVMQYWYEDFSSQYGDYGWLEYDEIENAWYVEIGYENWEKVENPPSYFWHTTCEQLISDNN